MQLGLLWIFVVGLCMAGSGMVHSYAARHRLHYFSFSTLTFLWGTLVSFVFLVWANQRGPIVEIPHYKGTIAMIALAGVLGSLGFMFIQWAMRRGVHGIVWAISQMAMMLPFVWASVWYGEPMVLGKLAGMLAIVLSIAFFALGRVKVTGAVIDDGKSKRWLIHSLLSFFLIGVSMTLSIVPSYWGVNDFETSRYLRAFVYLSASFLTYGVGKLITRDKTGKKELLASFFHFTMSIITSNLLYVVLDDYEALNLAGIVFPAITIVSILAMAVYGKYAIREKYTRYHVGGFALGLLGIAFLGASGVRVSKEQTVVASEQEMEKTFPMQLQLDWYAEAEYGGFFQAAANGGYAREGLSVEFIEAAPGFPFMQNVATGKAEVGVIRYDRLVSAVQAGLPLVAVGVFMEHSPSAIMVNVESDVRELKDLHGKKVMIDPSLSIIDWIKKRFAIDFAVVPNTWELSSFITGAVDAQQCFVTSEPFYLKQQGVEVRTMLISESGFDPYRVIYTNRTFLKKHPEQVRAFVKASIAGWRSYFAEDNSEANAMIASRNEKLTPEYAAWTRKTMLESGVVFGPEGIEAASYGYLQKNRLDAIKDVLVQLELLESDFELEQTYDLSVLQP